jgi:hypothetical protein
MNSKEHSRKGSNIGRVDEKKDTSVPTPTSQQQLKQSAIQQNQKP